MASAAESVPGIAAYADSRFAYLVAPYASSVPHIASHPRSPISPYRIHSLAEGTRIAAYSIAIPDTA
eukprot:988058-Rhodomonas_salina.1